MARRKGKNINGILLLDKPYGISSNAALQKARYLFNAKKAGHTGNLDPLATGVLPICFGEASKVTAFLLDSDKRYQCTVQLGTITSTGDKEGEVLQTREIKPVTVEQLETVLAHFRGDIEQIPPMHSALKHNGQPLYKLARQGIKVERKARQITIHQLELLDKKEDSITLDVLCSKGTYIRTLAEDIGEALGSGAHLSMLRRTEVRPFDCSKLYTLEELAELAKSPNLESILLPIDAALEKLPEITLTTEETQRIKNGLKIKTSDIPNSEMIRIYDQSGAFIGIGKSVLQAEVTYLVPKRLLNTQS